MKRLNQFIGLGLLASVLSAPTFAHPGQVPSGGLIVAPEHFFSTMQQLLPVIAVVLLIAVLLRHCHGRSTRGTTFRDWLAGLRR